MNAIRCLAVGLAATIACNDGPPVAPPQPPPPPHTAAYQLSVWLQRPQDHPVGAVLFELRGGTVISPSSHRPGLWIFADTVSSTITRFVVVADDFGSLASPLLSFQGDRPAEAYVGSVLQVGDIRRGVHTSLDGYRVTIRPR